MIGNLETRIQEMQKVPRDIQSTLKDLKIKIDTMESHIRHLQTEMVCVIEKYDTTPPNMHQKLRVLTQSIDKNSTCIHVLEEKFDYLRNNRDF
jgi:predicted RNase H-like nuclease (RuvC/YqgF family)